MFVYTSFHLPAISEIEGTLTSLRSPASAWLAISESLGKYDLEIAASYRTSEDLAVGTLDIRLSTLIRHPEPVDG